MQLLEAPSGQQIRNTLQPTNNTREGLAAEPHISMVIRLTLYAVVFVLTVLGNMSVIMVIIKKRKLRSIETYYYGYYLLNLAIADLSVALFVIPFTVVYNESGDWPFSAFLCKLIPTLLVASLCASILTLLVLTCERYWSMCYPFKPRLTRNKLLLILGLVWILSFAAASPELVVYQLRGKISKTRIQEKYPCAEQWANEEQRQAYTMFLFIFSYLLPLVVILSAYLKIVYELKTSEAQCFGPNEKDITKKTVRVLVIVVASFALCYLPEKVLFIWIDYGSGGTYPYIDILVKYSYFFQWLNSCLNPIIYGAVDMNFRNGYASFLRRFAGFKKKLRVSRSSRQGTGFLTSVITPE
ncbi:neuropeptide FF receptor 2-like [Dendronephthya gigantea]|uniref:neuropeptide FF receptor 2-like n=1 Tax=Dendronephthya gigantea TaxID=151771 RepID=UPI00106AA1CE|nr:neuropeptide FF receptor 2-like [Dendronephthya gigantea]